MAEQMRRVAAAAAAAEAEAEAVKKREAEVLSITEAREREALKKAQAREAALLQQAEKRERDVARAAELRVEGMREEIKIATKRRGSPSHCKPSFLELFVSATVFISSSQFKPRFLN